MTLIAAMVCDDDAVRVVADSGAGDELTGMTYRNQKVWQIGDYPLVWGFSGASWLVDTTVHQRLASLAYDTNLGPAIRRVISDVNGAEIRALMVSIPYERIDPGGQLLNVVVAGYWPDGRPGIYQMTPSGTAAMSPTPWAFIGSGGLVARVALEAIQAYCGDDFQHTERVLYAICEAVPTLQRRDVGRPFKVSTITRDDTSCSDWKEHL